MIPNSSLERIEIRFQINVKRPNKKVKLSQTGPDHNGGVSQEILPVSWDKDQPSHLPSTIEEPLNSLFVTQQCHDPVCRKLKESHSHQISSEHTASSLKYEDWSTVANKTSLLLFIINQKTSNEAWQYPIKNIQESDGRFESPKRLTFIPSPSTQVRFSQPNDWLTYEMKKKIKLEFLADEEEMLFTRSCPFQNLDKTRTSKLIQNHPLDPTHTSSSSLEEKAEDIFNFSSNKGIQIQNEASEMLQIVLNLLVTGKFGQETRKHCPYKLETPYPKKSLAKLVPSLFAVGFSWSVAINFKYLSTIANAMSNSLNRNCLSPSLQKKLSHIASLTYRDDLATSATERLFNALYMSLWGMMQNKLNEQPNRKSQSRSPLKYSDGDHVQSSQVSISSNQKDLNFYYREDYNDEETTEHDFHESLLNDLNDPDLLNEELEKKEFRYRSGDSFTRRKNVPTFCSKDEDLLLDIAVEEDSMLI
ncbi:hypothetical protein Golomagni_01856 [Golovinomyces magnicellulatus]|nr:hypothetical protein Golomagni_01856 [Golovinomyces magnicellulatus]